MFLGLSLGCRTNDRDSKQGGDNKKKIEKRERFVCARERKSGKRDGGRVCRANYQREQFVWSPVLRSSTYIESQVVAAVATTAHPARKPSSYSRTPVRYYFVHGRPEARTPVAFIRTSFIYTVRNREWPAAEKREISFFFAFSRSYIKCIK